MLPSDADCVLRTGNEWGLLTSSGRCCVSGHTLSRYCLPLWDCAGHSGRLMGRRWGDDMLGSLRIRGEGCFLGESELVGLVLTLGQNFLYPCVPLNLFFFLLHYLSPLCPCLLKGCGLLPCGPTLRNRACRSQSDAQRPSRSFLAASLLRLARAPSLMRQCH